MARIGWLSTLDANSQAPLSESFHARLDSCGWDNPAFADRYVNGGYGPNRKELDDATVDLIKNVADIDLIVTTGGVVALRDAATAAKRLQDEGQTPRASKIPILYIVG